MSDPARISIFFIGATGYIGGSVLARLLAHPKSSTFDITIISRSAEKADHFEKLFPIKAVAASMSDYGKLEELASQSDYVFNCADADNLEANEAILKGLKKRYETTGSAPILIHTSGTGVISDNAEGLHSDATEYNDANPAQIETIPDTAMHRNVDLAIVQADKEGYARTYIVLPSTIYGLASNPLVDAKLQNPHSVQIPALIKASYDRGQGGMVGEGKNVWPNVHIDDVADLYIVIFNATLEDPSKLGHGREGFYFGENGTHSLYQVGEAISKALFELGKSSSPTPTTFTDGEINKYFGGNKYLGSNSRCRADRSRSIGWKPKHTTDDMLASIKPETQAFIEAGTIGAFRDKL